MGDPRGWCYECGNYGDILQGIGGYWYCYQCWADTNYEVASRAFKTDEQEDKNEIHKRGEGEAPEGFRSS